MRVTVSRGTAAYDDRGRKLCSRCKQRLPAKGQRYCIPCHREDMAERRAGMVEVLLTREEWAAVKAARKEKDESPG